MFGDMDRTDRVPVVGKVVGKEALRCLPASVVRVMVMIYRSDWYPYPIPLEEE
jgi:hypothetical protein